MCALNIFSTLTSEYWKTSKKDMYLRKLHRKSKKAYFKCFKILPLTLSTCMFWLALDTVTETFVHVQASDCLTDCKLRAVICFLCEKTWLATSRSWFSILPILGKRIGIDRWMSIPQWRINDRVHSVKPFTNYKTVECSNKLLFLLWKWVGKYEVCKLRTQ